jgi:hypothetical protein
VISEAFANQGKQSNSAASARSQCSPPDPNSKLTSKVFLPAGPQVQALDRSVLDGSKQQIQYQSVFCRTSTASAGSHIAPDLMNLMHKLGLTIENRHFEEQVKCGNMVKLDAITRIIILTHKYLATAMATGLSAH